MKTIIEEKGFLTGDEAAKKLGVKKSNFNRNISKFMGQWIGKRKYYLPAELDKWVEDKIPEQRIKPVGDNPAQSQL